MTPTPTRTRRYRPDLDIRRTSRDSGSGGPFAILAPSLVGRWQATNYDLANGRYTDLSSPSTNHLNLGAGNGVHLDSSQAGGPAKYFYLPGVASNNISTVDTADLDILGDIDIRVRVAPEDWSPGAEMVLAGKRQGIVPMGGYALRILTSGALRLDWDTGVAILTQTSDVPSLTDGTAYWVRATLDVASGGGGLDRNVTFYTSTDATNDPDAVAWTQLSTHTTVAGATSIGANTEVLRFGTDSAGTGNPFTGRLYAAAIYDGIGGTKVIDMRAPNCTVQTLNFVSSSRAFTLNRSASGRKLVVVVRPVTLLGTDDFLATTGDVAAFDFADDAPFTVVAVTRQTAYAVSQTLIAKRNATGAAAAGWQLRNDSATAARTQASVADGSAEVNNSRTSGKVVATLYAQYLRSTGTSLDTGDYEGTTLLSSTPGDITALGAIGNAVALRVGALAGGSAFADMEWYGAAIWSRALSDAEIKLARTMLLTAF